MMKTLRAIALVAILLAADPAIAQAPQPIPGAGEWLFINRLPFVDHPTCVARTNGAEVDTMLMLNNDQHPLLVAGHGDWSGLSGEVEATIAIDGSAPVHVSAGMVQNIAVVLVTDPALIGRLRSARRLEWTLPFGHFKADVTGLGVALDAIFACATSTNAQGQHLSASFRH
ncbi:MAG: hypothetical protein QOH47_2533 [Sphingomonadales bacterium]|jgi:hypothetical protein|nr:hypothetical protein [Sphingomonadales bacterium]